MAVGSCAPFMRAALFLFVLSLCVACKKPPAPAEPGTDPAAAPGIGAAPQCTDAKMRAYLKLQVDLFTILGPLSKADGGRALLSDVALAQAEARVRKTSGLTDSEVKILNDLATALIVLEVMRKLGEMGSLEKQLAEAKEGLPDGSVPEVDQALLVVAERKKRYEQLPEERARFGDALINAAQPHRQALMENWSKLMDAAGEIGEVREGEH